MTKYRVGLLLVFFFLGGCAISPQSIQLNPSVTVPESQVGQGKTINVNVVDKREVKALGTRGGIYASTALVTISGGPEEPIRQELVGALSAYGFNVVDAVNADINLAVEIEKLGYTTSSDEFPKTVMNSIVLRAVCQKDAAEFTSRFTAKKEQEILVAPTAHQNETMINGLVSRALSALITDKRLLEFMR